jgi:excisionase family DNA binding protein
MTSSRVHSLPDSLLTPAEVAALFRVDPKTVTRWARSGKLACIRTLGGHRRYLETPGARARHDAGRADPHRPSGLPPEYEKAGSSEQQRDRQRPTARAINLRLPVTEDQLTL